MTLLDYIKAHEKTAGKDKAIETLSGLIIDYAQTVSDKSHITPLGTEILNQESAVSTKTKPQTLREKIAELDLLAQRVMERKALAALQHDLDGTYDPDEEIEEEEFEDTDEEDLSFGSEKYIDPVVVDENGDKSISIAEDVEDDGEKPAPLKQAGEKPSDEASESK